MKSTGPKRPSATTGEPAPVTFTTPSWFPKLLAVPGEDIWTIKYTPDPTARPCKFCEGAGAVIVNMRVKTCPVCEGKKTDQRLHRLLSPIRVTVYEIGEMAIRKDGLVHNPSYWCDFRLGYGDHHQVFPHDLFHSEEEALAEIAKREQEQKDKEAK